MCEDKRKTSCYDNNNMLSMHILEKGIAVSFQASIYFAS